MNPPLTPPYAEGMPSSALPHLLPRSRPYLRRSTRPSPRQPCPTLLLLLRLLRMCLHPARRSLMLSYPVKLLRHPWSRLLVQALAQIWPNWQLPWVQELVFRAIRSMSPSASVSVAYPFHDAIISDCTTAKGAWVPRLIRFVVLTAVSGFCERYLSAYPVGQAAQ